MMKSTNIVTRARTLIASAALCMSAMSAPLTEREYADQDVGPHDQTRLFQGRAIAPRAAPGAITEQELECESGGSRLRCSFEVTRGEVTRGEVTRGATICDVGANADAGAGAVVKNSAEAQKSA